MTRLRFTIEVTMEPTALTGDLVELTDEEIEVLRERLVQQANAFGRGFRPMGRGKGWEVLVLPDHGATTVTYHGGA